MADFKQKIAILFFHPTFHKSRINKALLKSLDDIEGITFRNMYNLYPDFYIDVKKEQEMLLAHDIIIWQHPFYWYSSPSLLKEWIDLVLEQADVSAPTIHAGLTSELMPTGLWRTMRPVVDYERCNRCWWVCSTFCPDVAIDIDDAGYPQIDYEHCKGCLICVAQCPPHAIEAIPEHQAQTGDNR